MLWEALPLYLAAGAVAGVLAGLLGVGGGLVIVPALAWLFSRQGVAAEVIMPLALGSSLATIVVTSISSTLAHHRRGAVRWALVALLAPGLLVGTWGGAQLADLLGSGVLKRIFALFEIAVAVKMVSGWGPRPADRRPGRPAAIGGGLTIGVVSALVGIGGGTLTVPFLSWYGVPMANAVATSAACGLPIALAGATGYLFAGLDAASLPPAATGFLYWPAILGIVSASALTAPLGARIAHAIDPRRLRLAFAGFLFLIGVWMGVGSL
ncbi:MAG TPA: sulfite exporter TauE/SafE family protein [Thiotrichales bacterium]|nr:sulfite exporter TauE/SafE family protein [Thiotrichales bacterium]